MANKPTKPNFPLGLESQDQSVFQEGILNNGVVEHGPDAVMTVPETPDASGVPSAVRYNEDDDQFEGYYNEGGWLPLGGGNGGRWEALPHASSSLLQAGRAYLVDNTDGVSTVLFPSPKRIGDSVTVCDLYGKFSTYPLTVDGNGKSIYGSADSMTISTDNVSATFTWTGEARGWVITSGVGLGQGRVYSREIYSQVLSAETSSITLSTQPTIVDVYADGKRLKESLYTLDGYEVKFDPALASGSDVQIIQYIPIQLSAGGGSSGGTVITWEYNGGAAIGGETQIVLDVVVDSVSEIYIRGQRQQIGRGFTFDAETSTITLADELETGDDVVVIINGDPTVYNQIDRTPWEVARANNVSNDEVILSTDKQTVLDGKTVLYDVATQTSWGIPDEDIPAGSKIVSVTGGVLNYNTGSADLLPISAIWLGKPNGFRYVGQVSSYSVLKTITPEYEGQRILLSSYYDLGKYGGGQFQAVSGNPIDDGGHICVPQGNSNLYWERVSDTVSLSDYGIFTQKIGDSNKVDMSEKLRAAIARSIALNLPLNTGISNENHYMKYGIYLESGVSITGIKTINGALPLIVDSSNFTGISAVGYSGITWVLTNLNATYGTNGMMFGTVIGNQLIDSITIRDINSRSAPLGGQLHTFSGTIVKGSLCATGFNGPGVYLASCYDSSIQDIRAISCGNTTYWGIFLDSYPADSTSSLDTSNHLTIGSIEPHDCVDKCLNANASSSFVGHIHEEASVVTDTSTWPSATISSNGFGWTNTILSGDWTTYGTVRILPAASTAANHVVTVLSNQVAINTLNAEGNVGIHFTYTTPRRGIAIGTLDVIYKLYVTADVYGKISSCQVRGSASVVTLLSATLNFGALNVTGASSTLTASGCVFEYLGAIAATLSNCTVLRGSIPSLTCNGACNISDIGGVTLVMSGSRNTLRDAYISGTSTFSGDGVISGCSLVGASSISGSYTIFGVKTNANLGISNAAPQTYSCVIRDSYIGGQLSITGYAKVKAETVTCGNLFINLTGGFLLLSDVQMSGSLTGNAISATNTPVIGSITKDPSTGLVHIYTATGWKTVSVV